MCSLSTFCESVLAGIISNLFFAFLIIWIFQRFRYYYYLYRNFNNKIFNTYWKKYPKDVVQTVKTKVSGNIITFEGTKIGSDDIFEGEIIMNPINLKIGEGFHLHQKSDGFAFIKVIIKDNSTFLVEAPYTGVKQENNKKEGQRIYQAFIWKRVG